MTKWSASQRPSVPVEKSSFRSVSGRGPGRFPGLFLTEVVALLDRERQHLNERSGRRVVDQFGRDLSPVRRNQNVAGPINPSVKTRHLEISFTIRQSPAPRP